MNPILVLTAFGAGFVASLSPCVYPMLPVTIGFLTRQTVGVESSVRRKWQILSFFLGQVFCFTLLGIMAVKLGEIFGFSSESKSVKITLGVLLLVMAVSSLSSRVQILFGFFNRFIPNNSRLQPSFYASFFMGALSSLVASPCTSPVLGGVLGRIATEGNLVSGITLMFAFSVGMSLIFLVAGLGAINLKNLPKSGPWLARFHKATAVMLFLASGFYLWQGLI